MYVKEQNSKIQSFKKWPFIIIKAFILELSLQWQLSETNFLNLTLINLFITFKDSVLSLLVQSQNEPTAFGYNKSQLIFHSLFHS